MREWFRKVGPKRIRTKMAFHQSMNEALSNKMKNRKMVLLPACHQHLFNIYPSKMGVFVGG